MGALVRGAHRFLASVKGSPQTHTHTHTNTQNAQISSFAAFSLLTLTVSIVFAASQMAFDTFDSPSFSRTQRTTDAERGRGSQMDDGRRG